MIESHYERTLACLTEIGREDLEEGIFGSSGNAHFGVVHYDCHWTKEDALILLKAISVASGLGENHVYGCYGCRDEMNYLGIPLQEKVFH